MPLLEDLYARLGKPVPTEPTELGMGEAALYDALAIAATHGKAEWYGKPETLPVGVKAVVLAVAERRVRNPNGYVSETAGEYTYRRPDMSALGLALTKGELALIERAAGSRGLRTVETVRAFETSDYIDFPWPNGQERWER
ncbi:hypothetical protein [Streptomyces sp. NPDC059708]|uniref:hypothetical protein n=1 Tax=Streptomyces sp. NPDC059708 TaxID=3346916 RepID=UPI00368DC5D0